MLGDKNYYPIVITHNDVNTEYHYGATLRERLVVALASNPAIFSSSNDAEYLIAIAENILQELAEEYETPDFNPNYESMIGKQKVLVQLGTRANYHTTTIAVSRDWIKIYTESSLKIALEQGIIREKKK